MATRIDTAQIETFVEPVCRAHGLDLVQVALATDPAGPVLRVLIDRPGSEIAGASTVSLGDCQAVSRDLNDVLDAHDDMLPDQYRLEVSSPGLDRPLVKLVDFDRFKGRQVRIQTRSPRPDGKGGGRRNFSGLLVGIDGETVRIEVDGEAIALPYAEIAKANVVHRFE